MLNGTLRNCRGGRTPSLIKQSRSCRDKERFLFNVQNDTDRVPFKAGSVCDDLVCGLQGELGYLKGFQTSLPLGQSLTVPGLGQKVQEVCTTSLGNHRFRSGLLRSSVCEIQFQVQMASRLFSFPSPERITSQHASKILSLFQLDSFTWLLLKRIKSDQTGLCLPDVNVSPEPAWALAFLTADGLFLKASESL